MFVVSGTKRSGTSMWMQVLHAAGLPVLGSQFPKNWGQGALRDANPHGFFEGPYRDGIFFGTNPDPQTGNYLRAEQTRGQVVKVFVPGVVRTELAFIDGVVANVRRWQDYAASVTRLWALEDEQRAAEAPETEAPLRVPAHLEWWHENFSLLRDHHQRGYPLMLQTYEQVLADPQHYVALALELIGEGDVAAACAEVKPSARTQREAASSDVEPRIAGVLDELYEVVAQRTPLQGTLLRHFVETDRELGPALAEIKIERARRMLASGEPPPASFVVAANMS